MFVTGREAVNVGAVLVEDFGIKPWSSIRTVIDTSDVYTYVCVCFRSRYCGTLFVRFV